MKPRPAVVAAILTVVALFLSACGGGGDESGAESTAATFSTCSRTDEVATASSKPVGDDTIFIGAFADWDESIASAYLMRNLLNRNGYTAQVKTMDIESAFTATAFDELDVLTDVWLPTTHQGYIDQYGDQLEALGCWYDNAKITIAVNDSSPAHSIGDLKTMGAAYQNTLVGIEPGAGETSVIAHQVIPAYGLHNLKMRNASTADMLESLRQAETNRANIAVTLWRPHWAYSEFDIRDLEDPKGKLGGTEGVWNFANKGFGERSPRAAQMFRNLKLSDAELSNLEDLITQKYRDAKDNAVIEWLNSHPAFADQVMSGSSG
ncbi:glycine betaine ABC transporter substrate-binding protein [Gordonia sp. CPCC 205515]|uniref:glycine betaine ABC transporter substrate-binding protein n=1 Tax=Gordonia sp. CPCC 205515 TaxID=3140791 RepID=UPI003AF3EED9